MGGSEPSELKLTRLISDDWGLMFESPKTGNSKSEQLVFGKLLSDLLVNSR